jgi:dipeptidyl aminopeptidase/acylaminoacyl peptidase
MKTEKVFWEIDGLRIVGETFLPSHPEPPFPALILCHGIPAKVKNPDDGGYPALAERFGQLGFEVLIFNFRGTGESEGDFDMRGWARDLEGALNFMRSDPRVDPRKIFLMGFSAGGAVSIYVAAHHPEVAGLIACAAPAEFGDILTPQGGSDFLHYARDVGIIRDPRFPPVVEEWRKNFERIQPLRWVERIPPRPFLLLHGTQDEVVPADHGRRLYEKSGGKAELVLIEGAGHRLRLDEAAMKRAAQWLIRESAEKGKWGLTAESAKAETSGNGRA